LGGSKPAVESGQSQIVLVEKIRPGFGIVSLGDNRQAIYCKGFVQKPANSGLYSVLQRKRELLVVGLGLTF
jgi:hypothetical protein